MTDTQPKNRLVLPALRAYMGDWIYYITTMKMRDVAERVSEVKHIHESDSLNDFIQRQLVSKHAEKIKQFLLHQPQRFFNTIVIGVYGGSPNWFELSISASEDLDEDDIPDDMEGILGILVLNGEEDLFAIDGQHRVVGIKQAVAESETLGNEEISAIFVPHSNDPIGMERTRRLFTRLNRYAKAVSPLSKIALDEDDVIAIVTRRLLDKHPMLIDKVDTTASGVNLNAANTKHLTTAVALYKSLNEFLHMSEEELKSLYDSLETSKTNVEFVWNEFVSTRPDDQVIEWFYQRSSDLYSALLAYIPELREFTDSEEENAAFKYRNREIGGHLLFRPVGLFMILRVIRELQKTGTASSINDAAEKISKVSFQLSDIPWSNLLWNVKAKRMITGPENTKAAYQLLFHLAGGDLKKIGSSYSALKTELAGLLSTEESKITFI